MSLISNLSGPSSGGSFISQRSLSSHGQPDLLKEESASTVNSLKVSRASSVDLGATPSSFEGLVSLSGTLSSLSSPSLSSFSVPRTNEEATSSDSLESKKIYKVLNDGTPGPSFPAADEDHSDALPIEPLVEEPFVEESSLNPSASSTEKLVKKSLPLRVSNAFKRYF